MNWTTTNKTTGATVEEVATHEDVYCDSLCELFRNVTGLENRMPRVIFG
jgi:hypothetical protein